MMVLNEKCKRCNSVCNATIFQRNLNNWTSGDKNIDQFIRETQLSAHNDKMKALEWIPYERLCGIKYVAENDVYRAEWVDGCIDKWDDETQNWKRYQNMFVLLKTLNNSNNITSEFMNEV
jgi:hypothetical protein